MDIKSKSEWYQRDIVCSQNQPQTGLIIKPQKVSEVFELAFEDDLCNQQMRKEFLLIWIQMMKK